VHQVRELMRAGDVTVIDVRAHTEWETGHLPGVVNIPLGLLPDRIAELPAQSTIVLQCETGSRSAIAASLLEARGWSGVANLDGGIIAWRQAGLPVVVESPVPV
jgi:hydroxyacylglutathione hydrolase